LYREGEGELMEASPFKFRSLSTASDLLIDMKKDKTKGEFVVLSPELENLIKKSRDESERMIILGTRRGLSPSTICGDCQNIVVCNNCSSPVVLHESNGKRFFMCHRCGERRSAEEYCKVCGSWKLTTIGIGIDLIREKIKEKFPDINVFKIDSDSTKGNEKTIKGILEKFRNHPGSILIGTELMLQYLHEKVENSAIVSLDSLFALPDFRIQEKILYMLTQIKTLTTKFFIVQTRRAEEKVFEYGLKGNLSDFYRSEIESRKNFKYPPFTNLIKITLEGKKENIINEMKEAQDILDPYEVEVFPAFTHTIRGNYVLHGLIRVPASKTLPKDLISKLRSLSPSITVKVDPETLL
jgi:primosomal protein N' (replication factor Y)